jgi:HSP20 family protein
MFDDLRAELDQLLERPWFPIRPGLRLRARDEGWVPRIYLYEKKGALVLKADLPGLKKEDVKITLEEGDLVIQGERREDVEVTEENVYRAELAFGSFYRRLPLGFPVEPKKLVAKMQDGVLEIHISIPEEKRATPQKIAVT